MKRYLVPLAVLVVALAPLVARAGIDAPHDQTFSTGACDNCHSLTDSVTKSATGSPDYSLGCITCHNKPNRMYPWSASDQGKPGDSGNQHSWSGYARNKSHGAVPPSSSAMQKLLVDGKLQCVVCHDAHRSNPAYAPDSQQTSMPVGTAVVKTGGPIGGSPTMMLVATGTTAKAFRVKLQTVTGTGGSFVISHDFGLATPTWFQWDATGGTWIAGTGTAADVGKPFTNDATGTDPAKVVALDDAAVTVRFNAAAGQVGDYWDFSITYPFLRASNVDDAFCYSCHAERVMTSLRVRGDDTLKPNGTRLFSHPVNEGLGSNGKGYDRLAGVGDTTGQGVLDTNGVAQSGGDGLASNNLAPHNGKIRCTTCHGVHGADSNSLTP